jgi:hypothetical protein
MAKKHTPWYIEFREVDYKDSKPIGIFNKASGLAIYDLHQTKNLCEKYKIWYKQQCINILKVDIPCIFRLYFETETELNAIKLMR